MRISLTSMLFGLALKQGAGTPTSSTSSGGNFLSVTPASIPSTLTTPIPTTYFPEQPISILDGSKINTQNKDEFIDQVKTVVDIINANKDAISTFDQDKWPDHISNSGDTGFSISTDAFEHAIQVYAPELKESVLYRQFKAMQAAHQPNQPECGFSRIAIDVEPASQGYIHTHGNFDGGVYTACAIPIGDGQGVGTQFASGSLLMKDPENPKGDLFYQIVSDTGVKQVPDYQFYSMPPKTPHGAPTSGLRIFMRMSGEEPYNYSERFPCKIQSLRSWFGLGTEAPNNRAEV